MNKTAQIHPTCLVGRVSAKRVTRQKPGGVTGVNAWVHDEAVGLRCANPTYRTGRFQGEMPSPEQIAERLKGWVLESDGFEGEGV